MKKKVTAEEFARMTDDESALTELDEGVVVTEPFLSWRAGRYSCVVCVALAAHAESVGSAKSTPRTQASALAHTPFARRALLSCARVE